MSEEGTDQRLRDEWTKVKTALQGASAGQVQDPLGEDGTVELKMNFFKANGGGEVVLLKGDTAGDHRYTRFRAWGPSGADFVEKSSYLVKADGYKEFHKRSITG